MITDLFSGVTRTDGRHASAPFSRSHSRAPTTDLDGGMSVARDGSRAKRSQSIASLRRHHGGRGLSTQQHHAADVELFESCVTQVQRNLKAHIHNPSTLHILASYYTRAEPVIENRPFCVSLSFATFLFHLQMARISLADVEVYVQLIHHILLQIAEPDLRQHPFVQQVLRDHVFGLPSPTCRGGAHCVVLVPTPQYRAYATLIMSLLALEAVPADVVYAFQDRLEYYANAASPMVSNRALALLVQGVSSSRVEEHVAALQGVLRRKSAKMNVDFLLACYERLKRAVVDVAHGPTFGRALSIYCGEIFLRFHSPIRRDYVERFLYPSLCHADMASFLTIPDTRQYLLRELLAHCTPGLAPANPFYLCLCALMQPCLDDETRGALATVELIACRMPHAGYFMSALAIDAHMSVAMFAKVMLSLARGAGWAMTGRTEHGDAVASQMSQSRTNVWNVLFVLREVVRSCSTTVSRRAGEMLHALALALPPATVEALGKLASEAFAGHEAQLALDPQRLCAELAMVLHQEHMAAAVEEAVGYLTEAATVCGYCGRQRSSAPLCPVNHTVHMSTEARDMMTMMTRAANPHDAAQTGGNYHHNNTTSLLSTLAECAGSRVLQERLIQYLRDPATQMSQGVHFLVFHILAHAGQHRRELYNVLEPYIRSTLLALVSADQQQQQQQQHHSSPTGYVAAYSGPAASAGTRTLVSSEHKANVLMLHVKMTLLFAQTMDPSYVASLLTVCAELTLRNTHDALALWYMSNLLIRHARGCMELLPTDPQECRYAVDFPGCAPESATAADNAQRVLRLLDRSHHFSPAMRKLVGCCVCRLIQDFNMQTPNIVSTLLSSHGFVPVGLPSLAEFALPVGTGSTFWGFVMHQMRTSAPARTALMTALVKSIALRFRIAAPARAVTITGAEATAHVFAVMSYEAMKRNVALARVVLYMMTQWMQQSGHTPGKFVCLLYLCAQLTVTVATRGSGAAAVELSAETAPDRRGFGDCVDKSVCALQRQQNRLARLAPAVRTESGPFYRLVRRLQRKLRRLLALAELSRRVDAQRRVGGAHDSHTGTTMDYAAMPADMHYSDDGAHNIPYGRMASSAADGVWFEDELAEAPSESSGDEAEEDGVFEATSAAMHEGASGYGAPWLPGDEEDHAALVAAPDDEESDAAVWATMTEHEALRRVRVELGEEGAMSMSELPCAEDDDEVFLTHPSNDNSNDNNTNAGKQEEEQQEEQDDDEEGGVCDDMAGDDVLADRPRDSAQPRSPEDEAAGVVAARVPKPTRQAETAVTMTRAAKTVAVVVHDPFMTHERQQQQQQQHEQQQQQQQRVVALDNVADTDEAGRPQTLRLDERRTAEQSKATDTRADEPPHITHAMTGANTTTAAHDARTPGAAAHTHDTGPGEHTQPSQPDTRAALSHALHRSATTAWRPPTSPPKSLSMNILHTPHAHRPSTQRREVATNTSPWTVTQNSTITESAASSSYSSSSTAARRVDKAVTAPFEHSVGTSPTLPGEGNQTVPSAPSSPSTHDSSLATAKAVVPTITDDAASSMRGSTWYEPDLSILFADGDTPPIDKVTTPQLQASCSGGVLKSEGAARVPVAAPGCAATVLPSSLVLEYLRTHQLTDSLTHEMQQLNSSWMYQQVASYEVSGGGARPRAPAAVMQTVAVESRPNNYAVPHRPDTVPAPLTSMQTHVHMQHAVYPTGANHNNSNNDTMTASSSVSASTTTTAGAVSGANRTDMGGAAAHAPMQPSLLLRSHDPGSHYSCGNSSSFYRDSASALAESGAMDSMAAGGGACAGQSRSIPSQTSNSNSRVSRVRDLYNHGHADVVHGVSRGPVSAWSCRAQGAHHPCNSNISSNSNSRGVTGNVVDGERPITPVSAEPVRDEDDDAAAAEETCRGHLVTKQTGGSPPPPHAVGGEEAGVSKRARLEERARVLCAQPSHEADVHAAPHSYTQTRDRDDHPTEKPPAQPIKRSAVQRGLEFFLSQGAASHAMSSVLQEVRRPPAAVAAEDENDDGDDDDGEMNVPPTSMGRQAAPTRGAAAVYATRPPTTGSVHEHGRHAGSSRSRSGHDMNNKDENENEEEEEVHAPRTMNDDGAAGTTGSTRAGPSRRTNTTTTMTAGSRQTVGETLTADNVPVATPYGQVVIPACFIEQRNDTAVREIQQVMGNYNTNDIRLSGGTSVAGAGGLASSGIRGAMMQGGKASMPAPHRSRNGRKGGRSTMTRENEEARRSSSAQWWTELSGAPMPEYAADPQYSMELF